MRGFFSLFLCFLLVTLQAQKSRLNNSLKMKLTEKPGSEKQYTLLVQGNTALLLSSQKEFSFTLNYYSGDIASITCKLNTLSSLIDQKIITYAELKENHIQPLNDSMVVRNRIKSVKNGAAPLAQAYTGNGIVMGIIDTGIDFNHPDFKDGWGNSRIKFLWDQVASAGSSTPSPFNYGIEWTDTQINANQCAHNPVPYFGHGTHVAGIAAGNGLANGTHEGCAPNTDLVVVALDFNKAGPITADAVQYIFNKATLLGKPCVINASVGDYYGSHDATDLEAKLIENLVKNIPGRVLVAAAGNAGNLKIHTKTQPAANDTSFTWLSNSGNTFYYWFYGDTNQVKNLQISVGANRSNYTDLGRTGFKNYAYGLTTVQHDTLKQNGNQIGIIHNSSSINNDGVYELFLQIDADSAGLLWRIETKGQGTHHAWNFDFVSSALPTTSQFPLMSKYVMPDTMYSMVSSYQCSDEIITVANYHNLNSYYDVNNILHNSGAVAGSLGPTSSSGPTRDGRQKPDIAASGNRIFSTAVLSMLPNLIATTPSVIAQGSMHISGGGTSASSPVVAGLAALYLQGHPTATNQQVKNAITQCAYSDVFTGTNLPDYRWGYGKLDGMAAMICGENPVSVTQLNLNEKLNYFPNPFSSKVTLDFGKNISGTLQIFSSDGKLLFSDKISGLTYALTSDKLGSFYSGLIFVKIYSAETNYAFKLIKN